MKKDHNRRFASWVAANRETLLKAMKDPEKWALCERILTEKETPTP